MWLHVALLSAQPRSLPVVKPRPLASSGLAQIPFGRKRHPYKPLPVSPLSCPAPGEPKEHRLRAQRDLNSNPSWATYGPVSMDRQIISLQEPPFLLL